MNPPGLALEAADYVVLLVFDLDASLAFYTESLGLRLAHRSGSYAQLDTGRTRISLYHRDAMGDVLGTALEAPPRGAPSFELGFKTIGIKDGQGGVIRPHWIVGLQLRSVQKAVSGFMPKLVGLVDDAQGGVRKRGVGLGTGLGHLFIDKRR